MCSTASRCIIIHVHLLMSMLSSLFLPHSLSHTHSFPFSLSHTPLLQALASPQWSSSSSTCGSHFISCSMCHQSSTATISFSAPYSFIPTLPLFLSLTFLVPLCLCICPSLSLFLALDTLAVTSSPVALTLLCMYQHQQRIIPSPVPIIIHSVFSTYSYTAGPWPSLQMGGCT